MKKSKKNAEGKEVAKSRLKNDGESLTEKGLTKEQAETTKAMPRHDPTLEETEGRKLAGTSETREQPDPGPEEEIAHNLDAAPAEADAFENGMQVWAEPYPTEGLVRVRLLEDYALLNEENQRSRQNFRKGDIIDIDARIAQSIHRFIEGVKPPEGQKVSKSGKVSGKAKRDVEHKNEVKAKKKAKKSREE